MVHRYLWWEAWQAPTDALLFRHEGASYSCSQWQAAVSPGEHPEKGNVQANLPVAAGPECTQTSESQVAFMVSLICEPLVLLAACTLFQQQFFLWLEDVHVSLSWLNGQSNVMETHRTNMLQEGQWSLSSKAVREKIWDKAHGSAPSFAPVIPVPSGATGSSNVGRNTLVCHRLIPVTCVCFRCKSSALAVLNLISHWLFLQVKHIL